jgi:hypothetical protein
MYSFSETQKQQKIGNWHCGILLVGFSSGNLIKMPRSVTKHKANGVKISMKHQKL